MTMAGLACQSENFPRFPVDASARGLTGRLAGKTVIIPANDLTLRLLVKATGKYGIGRNGLGAG
jgi:hypothetical protein